MLYFLSLLDFFLGTVMLCLVSRLCIERLAAPYPFTHLCATLNLRQFIPFLLIDKLPHTTSPLPKERSMHQGASCRAADTQQLAVPMVTSLSLTSVIFCLAVG